MPKLDGTHIADRLRGRLEELREGKAVAARDVRALLTDEQVAAMDTAWAEQQLLKNKKQARTKEEKIAWGWKTKREIQIEAYERAVAEADYGMLDEFERLQLEAKKRQIRIYYAAMDDAVAAGKDKRVAEKLANNALTQAGLRRIDGQKIGTEGLKQRDKEIRAIEDALQEKTVSEMDDYEREQYDLSQKHEKALVKNRKEQGL